MENELTPTAEHLNDPYILQVIEALSSQQDDIEELMRELDKERIEISRLHLVAGRYQFMWEAAQLCLNKIDDYVEYNWPNNHKTFEGVQKTVQQHLANYTEAVAKPKSQIGK